MKCHRKKRLRQAMRSEGCFLMWTPPYLLLRSARWSSSRSLKHAAIRSFLRKMISKIRLPKRWRLRPAVNVPVWLLGCILAESALIVAALRAAYPWRTPLCQVRFRSGPTTARRLSLIPKANFLTMGYLWEILSAQWSPSTGFISLYLSVWKYPAIWEEGFSLAAVCPTLVLYRSRVPVLQRVGAASLRPFICSAFPSSWDTRL